MKKALCFGFLVCMQYGIANAGSSVTLYGLLDTSVAHISGAESRTLLLSGAGSTGRFGMRGEEDLGGGLSAIFKLEAKVIGDTGDAGAKAVSGTNTTAGAGLFSRGASVGLKGGFGTLLLGRDSTSAILTAYHMYASPLGINMGPVPVFTAQGVPNDFWNSNQIRYDSPSMHGLVLSVSYAPGESTQNSKYGTSYGISATYKASDFLISAANQHDNDQARSGHVNWSMISGKYFFGNFRVLAGWDNVKNETKTPGWLDSRMWSLGGGYKMPQNLDLSAQYLKLKDTATGKSSDQFNVVVNYDFSKRTALYGYAIRTKNESAVLMPVNGASGVAYKNQTAIGAGIQHKF